MDSTYYTRNPNTNPHFFVEVNENFLKTIRDLGVAIENSENYILASDKMLEMVPQNNEELIQETIVKQGSFLGESLIKLHDGKWMYDPKQERWVVVVKCKNGDDLRLNVFRKVENFLRKGDEDLISYWYEMTKRIIESGIDNIIKK